MAEYVIMVGGKLETYNNYNDIFASLEILISLKSTGTVIVKHANPSGVSINKLSTERVAVAETVGI